MLCCRWSRTCTGNRSGPRRPALPIGSPGGTRPARSRRPSRPLTPCACAVRGWACGSPRRSRPSRRSAGRTSTWTRSTVRWSTPAIRPGDGTGSPRSPVFCRCSATRRWVRPIAASNLSRRRRLVGGGHRGIRHGQTGVHRGEELRSGPRGRSRPLHRLPAGGGSVAHRPQPGCGSGCLRAVVGHRRSGWLPESNIDSHVQALDGQGVELGSLLQCAGARRRCAGPGAGPVPRSVRPPGPQWSTTGLGDPFGGSVQLRQTPHSRLGPAPTPPQAADRSRPEDSRHHLLELSSWTRFWLDARRVPGQVLAHYQHGNDSGWDNSTVFDDGG